MKFGVIDKAEEAEQLLRLLAPAMAQSNFPQAEAALRERLLSAVCQAVQYGCEGAMTYIEELRALLIGMFSRISADKLVAQVASGDAAAVPWRRVGASSPAMQRHSFNLDLKVLLGWAQPEASTAAPITDLSSEEIGHGFNVLTRNGYWTGLLMDLKVTSTRVNELSLALLKRFPCDEDSAQLHVDWRRRLATSRC